MNYLVRLVEKSEYASQLIAGQLRLMPAGYYIKYFEYGRGDVLEGAISKDNWANISFPILCLTECPVISDTNSNPFLKLDKTIIQDFCKCGGYAVAVEKETFIDHMRPLIDKSSNPEQPSYHGSIIYDLDKKDFSHWQKIASEQNGLLHKSTDLSYQKEYRFVFSNPPSYTFWVDENFNQPWWTTVADFQASAYAFRIPPICEIEQDALLLRLTDDNKALHDTWNKSPKKPRVSPRRTASNP